MKIITIQSNDSILEKTWSPRDIIRNKDNVFMYLKKDGLYTKIDRLPQKRFSFSWHTNHLADSVIWLSPENADRVNQLLREAQSLEAQAKKLREEAKNILS